MKTSKLTIPLILLLAVSLVDTTEAQETETEENPKIVAITMHADWCGTCKELNPKVENVQSDFEDEGVLFTKFDFTDDFTIKQSRLMANWIGIGDIFRESQERGATGYMILVDGETYEMIGRITNEKNENGIRDEISAHL